MDHSLDTLRARTQGARYVELDGLRGWAAFTVILHHFCYLYDLREPAWLIPILAGHEAVLLFFLLSGFVLSLPFWNRGSNGPYGPYLIRRIFRIYVPYLGAVVLAALGMMVMGNKHLPLGDWYALTWQQPLSFRMFFDQVLMSPSPVMNTAFWSLRYEMQMSIAFPLVVWLISRAPSIVGILIALALNGATTWMMRHHVPNWHYALETVHYGSLFVVGAILARERAVLRGLWDRMGRVFQWIFIVVSCLAYWGIWRRPLYVHHLPNCPEILLVTGAVGLLLAAMYAAPLRRLLSSGIPEYLGRISYSLYLVHGTVLFFLANLLYGRLGWTGILPIYLVIAIGLAHLFCVTIEEPALRAGKLIAGKFRA